MNNEIIRLRIVTQNALLGKITKEVRGVYVKIDKNCISICVVIDGPISDYWNEEIYEIGTSIISNFNENYNINENLIRVDYPISLFFDDYLCVYKRYKMRITHIHRVQFKKRLTLNSRIKSAVKFDRTFYFNYFNLSSC